MVPMESKESLSSYPERKCDRLARELESVFRYLPEGVVFYGPHGEILRSNSAADAFFGFSLEDKQKTIIARCRSGAARDPSGKKISPEALPVMRALAGEVVRAEIIDYRRSDGRRLWLSVSAAPMSSSAGQCLGAAVSITNISRQQELQEERESLLCAISHDLFVPLTVILGHTEMLKSAIASAGLGEVPFVNIKSILSAGEQMRRMIEDLSDMARIETGELKPQKEALELGSYIGDFLQRVQVAMEISRVNTDIEPGLPPVWADPQNLERCLSNLLGNALKYAPGTWVVLRVRYHAPNLKLMVIDEGPGIAAEDLPHIFERFFRVRKADTQGLGLGLFITRALVEADGGRIWAESEPGCGSTFSFTLPARK